jgi:2-keto-3-deoxy-L-rhamnonate aldolase RhmA
MRVNMYEAGVTMTSVRSALLRRQLLVGSWIQIANAASAEILAHAGFDWIGIDMEHTDIDMGGLAQIMRGMYGRGASPIVRVEGNDVVQIRKALDLGASAEEARKAVRAAKYPPDGVRGYCFSRMNNWGVDFSEYAGRANGDVAVIVMIETKAGVEQVDEIVSVDGVDGVFIGPYDMSGSYGVPGETDGPVVAEACSRVTASCRNAGKSVGLHVVNPTRTAVGAALGAGYNLICLGVDTVFLNQGAVAARHALAEYQATGQKAT